MNKYQIAEEVLNEYDKWAYENAVELSLGSFFRWLSEKREEVK